jgi:ATP-dependent helicase/nuclease subunit B
MLREAGSMQEQVVSALQKGAIVVTATRRLARSLRQEYNAIQQVRGLKAWQSPAILTWSGWISELWQESLYSSEKPRTLLREWQELILWERVIQDSPGSSELLQVHATASAAQEAWLLASAWRLDLAQIENLGNEDARAFVSWAGRFREICNAGGWIEWAGVADALLSAFPRFHIPTEILPAGFDEFTPQQQSFLKAFSGAGCNVTSLHPTAPATGTSAACVPFPDPEQEMEAAARWVRALLESGRKGKIGVVIAGLASRRNVVERVFRCCLESSAQLPGERKSSNLINISAGNPLSSYPMIRSALAILGLAPGENEWDKISSLIRSPHLRGADKEYTSRAMLDARMRRDCGSRTSISYVRRLCREHATHCPLLDRAFGDWLIACDQSLSVQTAGQWSRTFSGMLEAFGWPGERPLTSSEFQTMQAWSSLLSEFASTDLTGIPMRSGEAVSLVRRIAGQVMFQPETEQASVQILGALEASGFYFDHLWIAGLHDEAWPAQANPNPFLPIRLQREKRIPRCSPERELEFATLITTRLLASGSNVILSYPACTEDRELAPSPLIASIPIAAPSDLGLWKGASALEILRESRSIERLVDEKGPPLIESPRQRGGTKVFQYQSGCPFRAFAELRLGAEELEFPLPGLDPRQRGILVHSSLEEIWKQLRTHAALCSNKDLPDLIHRAVDAAITRFERERGSAIPVRFAALERERLRQLIAEWLAIEKTRQPFEVIQPEGERFAEVSGIRCKVKIDRIDRLSDGREVIIDYKTGEPNLQFWFTDRPDEPQLPLYSTIHEKPLAGVLYAQIKTGKSRFLGLVDKDVEMPGGVHVDLPTQIKAWRSILEKLGSDFRAGCAEVNPKDPAKNCRYCPLPFLCRIAETKAASDEEEAK